jgi:hypothetical protein
MRNLRASATALSGERKSPAQRRRQCFRRLLDRTPSERSEASWSFYSMSDRSIRSHERSIGSAAERDGH